MSLFSLASVHSSGAAEKQLSMLEAVRLAITDSHELRAFKYNVEAGREEIGIARSSLFPRISFEERFTRTNNPPYAFMTKLGQERIVQQDFNPDALNKPNAVNDFQSAVSFEQILYSPKTLTGVSVSKKNYAGKLKDLKRKREESAMKTLEAFLMVNTAKAYLMAADKAVEEAQEHLRIAELRYGSGLGIYSDALRAATILSDAEKKALAAHKNYSLAKRLLGLSVGREESIDAGEMSPEIQLMPQSYYIENSLDRNDLASLRIMHENAKEHIKLAEAGYHPVIAMGGTYQLNDNRRPLGDQGDSWQVLAFLRWDVFDGFKRDGERAKAKAQAAEIEENWKGFKNTISFRIYSTYLEAEETQKNIELSKKALSTAEEGMRLIKLRYENSLSPMVDLIDAQTSLDNARAEVIARENNYRLAVIRLGFESGTILKDMKIE
ncbi:MAG: TolC family protein [Nitrospirae bacterium]|nr:TolC family protein [Nitrospirota bacterium]